MKEDLDKRIERVAESVGLKKAEMRQWESERVSDELRRKASAKRWRTYGISAAASVVVICGICFGFFINRGGDNDYGVTSTASVYRGGSYDISEIKTMIDSSHYEEALQAIEATMADTIIDSSFTPERRDYLRTLNASRDYELTWLRIDVLVKSGKTKEAVALLKEFVDTDGAHQEEAKHLLHKLTK